MCPIFLCISPATLCITETRPLKISVFLCEQLVCAQAVYLSKITPDLPVANRAKLLSFVPFDYNHHLLPERKTSYQYAISL